MTSDLWSATWDSVWGGVELALPAQLEMATKEESAPAEDAAIVEIIGRHQTWTDLTIGDFESALKPMVEAAAKRTVAQLEAALSITDGTIDPTAANDKVLAGADDLFMEALNAEGYPALLAGYTKQFGEQLPYLQEMLTAIGDSIGQELPAVNFSPTDLKVLGRIEATTISKLDRIFSGAASTAMDRVMFSVAGLPFEQLVATVATQMGKTLESARTWADTAVSSWYRTAASLTFEEIQSDTQKPLKFRYSGPQDLKTRPFCKALLIAGKSYTRDEINGMDNGQLPNVFITCGGYNCRHLFILAAL